MWRSRKHNWRERCEGKLERQIMFCIGCVKKGFDKLCKIDEERGGIRRYFKVKG